MTLRAKPVVKKPGRSGWNSEERRTLLTNLGFVLAIVLAVLILLGYAGYSWYDSHFGTVATVDGTSINRDQLRARLAIEDFRIKYTESRIRTLNTAGRLSEASMTSQLQFLDQRRQSIGSIALERLIDNVLQARLAVDAGVSVTDAEIDTQFLSEATIDEMRHAWVIELTPANDPTTGKPGDAEKAAARAEADNALAQLTAGKSWEDVANSVSDSASAAQDGDLGWLPRDSGYDEAFMAAAFDAKLNTPTAVIEGADGVFRIGRVTEVAEKSVDETYQSRLDDANIKTADYRAAIRGDLIRKALDAKVVADLSKPSLQRQVEQIFLTVGTPQPDGVKVRHILISPKNDPSGAAALPADDPTWKAASDEATLIYSQVIKDPTKFDELARASSDEPNASSTGGKLPYYDPTSPIDATFAKAIFAAGLQPGQILAPIRTSFGWDVIQYMRPFGDGEAAWLNKLRTDLVAGADFEQVARDQGEGPEAATGGDIGWVATGQFGDLKETPIFSTAVGDITDVTTIANEGVYLWKVVAEEMREPTAEQITSFKDTGFTNWYALKKAEAKITRNTGTSMTTQ
ncbi:MAG: peptidylprolyl isomerase [Chloroflexi bacterium]|nr:peptidylprolyl isomerase [Chloroflexota bacterium]